MTDITVRYIGGWEHYGVGEVVDGHVDIGGVKVPHMYPDAHIYVKRLTDTGEVADIGLAMHDGLANAALGAEGVA